MKDVKVLQIDAGTENETIRIWQKFGYELRSTQDVVYGTTDVEQGILDLLLNRIIFVTKRIHYVKLVLERDHNIPHYQELKELEDQFNSVPYPGDRAKPYSAYQVFIGLMCCTIPGLYMLIRNKEEGRTPKEYAIAINEYKTKQGLILEKAAAIVGN